MTRETFNLGDVNLQSGETLIDARLVYRTLGTLNAARDNVIVMPSYYTGSDTDNAKMIAPGRALDPDRYFIVLPNMFGNGVSSSPSNAAAACRGADFPAVSVYDNISCQHRLLTELWDIQQVRLVCGWSMGAQQTFEWGAHYPEMVKAILPWCGSAKTSAHNYVFLDGVKAALKADSVFADGRYTEQPVDGLKAFGRVYAGWAYSQTFYREATYRHLGFDTVEALLVDWENDHLTWDANDLLAMLRTWQHADISANETYNGNFREALGAISARAIVMPGKTDLYFPPQDSYFEVEHMPDAECRVIPSDWGHLAGSTVKERDPPSTKMIETAICELLS